MLDKLSNLMSLTNSIGNSRNPSIHNHLTSQCTSPWRDNWWAIIHSTLKIEQLFCCLFTFSLTCFACALVKYENVVSCWLCVQSSGENIFFCIFCKFFSYKCSVWNTRLYHIFVKDLLVKTLLVRDILVKFLLVRILTCKKIYL